MSRVRESSFAITLRCRFCGRNLVVQGVADLLRQPIAFGGAPTGANGELTVGWVAPVTCPEDNRVFDGELLIPAQYHESVQRVRIQAVTMSPDQPDQPDQRPDAAAPAPAPEAPAPEALDWVDEELREWRRTTVATQRSYTTTMLATSSGAVAVYFSVLKYLGWEKADFGTALVVLTMVSPVLLLGAAASFSLALRPSLTLVERDGYAEFRSRRVHQIHRRATTGALLYLAALIFAVASFVIVLQEAA